mgnify:CR=1 FL=1
MKVLLVDDPVIIHQSSGAQLASAPDVEVVGWAEDVATALAAIAANPPDLIVLDVRLRGHDRGLDVLRRVRLQYPGIKVVVFSQFNWSSMRKTHLEAGALAYFDKATEFQQARDWIAELSLAHAAQAKP